MDASTPPTNGLYRDRFLKSLPLEANTIIDVGVRTGTPQLYRGFPDAEFLLVDPQEEGESILKYKPKNYRFRNVALGASPGTAMLSDDGGRSSLLERTKLTQRDTSRTYPVEVTTLDDLLDEADMTPPYGIKIDTEGFEIEVLRGLRKHAQLVEFIICEVSVKHRFVGGYRFSDLVAEMKTIGQEFYTVMNPPILSPRFYDCLFLRSDHPLFGELT